MSDIDHKSVQTQKVPSQIFRWFERMKNNYENSVQTVLNQFENFSAKQQARLDKSNDDHIANLKYSQQLYTEQSQQTITRLEQDISYYKQQITMQQQTISQLNNRYDAVMGCLLVDKRKDIDLKEIFSDNDFIEPNITPAPITPDSTNAVLTTGLNKEFEQARHTTENNTLADTSDDTDLFEQEAKINNSDELFDQAITLRQSGDTDQAFILFQQAAKQGHQKAMGAMGRSYFLAEGIDEDHSLGLAWLINAAESNLAQAISRVKHFEENDPDLYQQALNLAPELI